MLDLRRALLAGIDGAHVDLLGEEVGPRPVGDRRFGNRRHRHQLEEQPRPQKHEGKEEDVEEREAPQAEDADPDGQVPVGFRLVTVSGLNDAVVHLDTSSALPLIPF